MTHDPQDHATRATLRALDAQRADTLADALRPDAAPVAPECTGVSAGWCPRCGDCTCPDRSHSTPSCPLHGTQSQHAEEPAEDLDDVIAERDELRAEVRRLRMELHGAQHALAEASRGRAAASLRAADAEHLATVAMRDGLAECERLRRMIETTPPWQVSDPPTDEEMRALRLRWAFGPERYQADADALIAAVMHGRTERAKLIRERDAARVASTPNEREAMLRVALDNREAYVRDLAALVAHRDQRIAELTRERDAALAAVDAVRADYAPRREPPTPEEVRALAAMWPRHDGAAVVLLRVPSRTADLVTMHVASVIVENDGARVDGYAAADMDRLDRADGWLPLGPHRPLSWSELAQLVAQGGV